MSATLAIWLAGVHSAAFALFHMLFWRLFGWRRELPKLGTPTRAILQILNLRLIHVFALMAVPCFGFTQALATTALGHALLAGMALFWGARLVEQFVFLRHDHIALHAPSVLFTAGAILFACHSWSEAAAQPGSRACSRPTRQAPKDIAAATRMPAPNTTCEPPAASSLCIQTKVRSPPR